MQKTKNLRVLFGLRGARKVYLALLLLLPIFLLTFFWQRPIAQAAPGINEQINFQGRLLSSAGAVVADGNYNMEFKIYEGGNGVPGGGDETLEWTETRTLANRVQVKNGYFSVMLGSVNPFGSSVDWNDDTIWLSWNIGGTADTPTWDGEMTPYKRFGVAPAAMNSKYLGGLAATNFVQLAQGLQTDASTSNASIAINKTGGTADILNLQRGGTNVLQIANGGSTLFKTTTDSTTGFQIQDADGGTAIFNVDTDNERIGIGDAAPDFKLDVAGDIRIQSANKLFFGGTGSGDNDVNLYRNGANELKTDDYFFSAAQIAAEQGGAAQTRIGAVGPSGQSAIVFGFDNADPVNLYRSAANVLKTDDAMLIQPASNTTTAFQVQNSSGNEVLTVNTSGGSVVLGKASTLNSNLTFANSAGANTVSFALQANPGSSYTLLLPTTAPSTSQCLQTDSVTANQLKFDSCAGAGGGVTTIGTIDSQTKSANGAVISGTTLYMQTADASNPGLVSTGTQTFAGNKTLTGLALFQNSTALTSGGQNHVELQTTANNASGNVDGLYIAVTSNGAGNTTGLEINNTAGSGGGSRTGAFIQGSSEGVVGYSANGTGVHGQSGGAGIGGYLHSSSGIGVAAESATGVGLEVNLTGAGTAIADFQDNSTSVVTISDGGAALFKNSTNSTTAFQVQNAAAGSLLNIDSTNANITLNGLNTGEVQSWQLESDTLPGARRSHSSIAANGYAYVIGGSDTTGASGQSTVYYAKLNANGSTGSWATTTALPAVRFSHTSVFANGYVYVMGGQDNSAAVTTVYYAKVNADGTLGSWTTNSNALPAARRAHSSITANGYVYVMGGSDTTGASPQSTVYYAKLNPDGSTGLWSTTTAITAARYILSSAQGNGYVYAIGGNDGSGTQSTVYYAKLNANGTIGSWSTATALTTTKQVASTAVLNGYLYVLGGNGSGSQNTVYYARMNGDGSLGSWSSGSNVIPIQVRAHTSIFSNGYIYVLGGQDSSVYSSVYYTSTSRILAAGSLDLVGLSGQNLNEGGTGGSLTAGNTNIVGDFNVQGAAQFNQSVGIAGDLTVQGSQVALNSSNNAELSAWQTNANALPAARSGNGLAMANGYMYVTGGETGGTAQTTVYYGLVNVDGSVNSFSTTTALPASRDYHTTVAANGYLYVIGGRSGGTAQTTVYYARINSDGTVGSWNTTSALTAALFDHSSIVANGTLYVIGGYNSGGTAVNTVYYAKINADGSLGSWSTTNTLPAARGDGTASVGNGYVYYAGGENSGQQANVYYAKLNSNGTTGSWASTTSLPANRQAPSSVILNGYLYVIGGTNSSTAQSGIYYAPLNADGTVGSWVTNTTTMPAGRADPTSLVTNGYIYSVGGNDGTDAVSSVYYASGARIKVGGSVDLVGLGGENLSEGGTGGTLTAGNTNIVGGLVVKDSTIIYEGLTVYNSINVNVPNAAAGDTLFNINNNTNNRIFTIEHMGTNFGSLVTAGGLIGLNSYFGEEFAQDRVQITGAAAQNWGLGGGTSATAAGAAFFSTGETGTCLWDVVNSGVGGIGIITANAAASVCSAYNSTTTSGTINAIFDIDNLPVITMKVRPAVASTGVPDNDHQFFMGLTTAVSATPAADRPTNFIGFTNCSVASGDTCDTTWRIQANDANAPVACTVSQTVSETQFATLQIKVLANNNIQFWIDSDASNGINLQLCGTITSIGSTAASSAILKADWEANTNASTLEVDYFRAWQDDTLPSGNEEAAQFSDEALELTPGSLEEQHEVIDLINALGDNAVFENDVHVKGTLYADKIKANQIEGLEIFTNRIASLEDAQNQQNQGQNSENTATTMLHNEAPQQQNTPVSSTLDLNTISVQTANVSLGLNVAAALTANGALTVGGPATFNADSIFNRLVTFIEKVVFNNDVSFVGRATYNNDAGGFAVINPGQTEVTITFTRPHLEPPVVTVTTKNGQFVDYAYKELSPTGFKIVLSQPALVPIEFAWTALSVQNAKTVQIPAP